MNEAVFVFLLLMISTLTGLVVEAIKKIMNEYGVKYHANTLAGVVASMVSILVSVLYLLFTGNEFDFSYLAYTIALVFLSWLCSMVGYDKVIQTLAQIKRSEKEYEE